MADVIKPGADGREVGFSRLSGTGRLGGSGVGQVRPLAQSGPAGGLRNVLAQDGLHGFELLH